MLRVAPLLVVAVVALAFAPALAADKPQDLIVGKWQPADAKDQGKATIEFLKDGKVKIVADQFSIDGTYKFLNDKEMEVKLNYGGEEQTQKLTVAIDKAKDELTTTTMLDNKEKKETFKRVK